VNSTEPERFVRRIVVAIDSSPHSLAALEAAAELATRFEAELHGIFVEDTNLLRLAELAFLQELAPFSATGRRIERQQMLRELHVLAQRSERVFRAIVAREDLPGDFQVVRGAVVPELLATAEEADILIMGKSSRAPGRPHRLGSTSRAALSGASCSTIVMQQDAGLGSPILIVYDGSPVAQRALAAAAALRAPEDDPLVVLLLAPDERAAARLHEEVAARLDQWAIPAEIHVLADGNAAALAHAVHAQPCGMLILPATAELLEDEAVLQLVDDIDIPVLLVR
jgi:nucleotide-binding universal stress UspA family protein